MIELLFAGTPWARTAIGSCLFLCKAREHRYNLVNGGLDDRRRP